MTINKSKYYSPLRYPGGKNKLAAFIAQICSDNKISKHYIEPYAGGASVALFLLFNGFVKRITINDKDRSIYALWYSILHHTDKLCKCIEECSINTETWMIQKEVQKNKNNVGLLKLGFSTLFLNRTNRSGIINGGAIGGVEQQGNYKMDCRFNKEDIIARIRLIASKKSKISLHNKDAIELINKIKCRADNSNTIIYFDPPYFDKGGSLYLNHYKKDDHLKVSEMVRSIDGIHWLVSYDNVDEIKTLYSGFDKKEYSFKHTAFESREGKEILFFSPGLIIPSIEECNPVNYKYDRKSQIIRYKVPKSSHSAVGL